MYRLTPLVRFPLARGTQLFSFHHIVIGTNISVSSSTLCPIVEAVPGGMGIDGGPVVGERGVGIST